MNNLDNEYTPHFAPRMLMLLPLILLDTLQLEADHVGLVEKLERVHGLIKELQAGGSVDFTLTEFVEYETMMRAHLQEEEQVALPLFRSYFTHREAGVIVQKIISQGKSIEMGSFVYYMGSGQFCNKFMKQEGIPFFVWWIQFKGDLKIFEHAFINNVKALVSGEAPSPVPTPWYMALFGKKSS